MLALDPFLWQTNGLFGEVLPEAPLSTRLNSAQTQMNRLSVLDAEMSVMKGRVTAAGALLSTSSALCLFQPLLQ